MSVIKSETFNFETEASFKSAWNRKSQWDWEYCASSTSCVLFWPITYPYCPCTYEWKQGHSCPNPVNRLDYTIKTEFGLRVNFDFLSKFSIFIGVAEPYSTYYTGATGFWLTKLQQSNTDYSTEYGTVGVLYPNDLLSPSRSGLTLDSSYQALGHDVAKLLTIEETFSKSPAYSYGVIVSKISVNGVLKATIQGATSLPFGVARNVLIAVHRTADSGQAPQIFLYKVAIS